MRDKIVLSLFAAGSIFQIAMLQQDTLAASIERGKSVYKSNCIACHMPDGNGLQGTFPPLAKTNRLSNKTRLVNIVLKGLNEPIVVKGETYEVEMPGVKLTDQEVMDVLNYVRNSWGNKLARVTVADVKKIRLTIK